MVNVVLHDWTALYVVVHWSSKNHRSNQPMIVDAAEGMKKGRAGQGIAGWCNQSLGFKDLHLGAVHGLWV